MSLSSWFFLSEDYQPTAKREHAKSYRTVAQGSSQWRQDLIPSTFMDPFKVLGDHTYSWELLKFNAKLRG